ncbi:MAG: hypothetical protein JRJ27_12640 [Deltaproteobacteria bacterium]|nr:hypothetical protein [Deltaproteobacteria bacterium]MBW2364225.1 hypothetical protein [Deltaproteobacteria bacterium]
MSNYLVTTEPHDETIYVKMLGEFDAKTLSESTASLVEELNRTSYRKILLDHSEATPLLSVLEQHERPEVAEKIGVQRECLVAIVYRKDHETYEFIETVARNKGFSVKIFTSTEEAVSWLRDRK